MWLAMSSWNSFLPYIFLSARVVQKYPSFFWYSGLTLLVNTVILSLPANPRIRNLIWPSVTWNFHFSETLIGSSGGNYSHSKQNLYFSSCYSISGKGCTNSTSWSLEAIMRESILFPPVVAWNFWEYSSYISHWISSYAFSKKTMHSKS